MSVTRLMLVTISSIVWPACATSTVVFSVSPLPPKRCPRAVGHAEAAREHFQFGLQRERGEAAQQHAGDEDGEKGQEEDVEQVLVDSLDLKARTIAVKALEEYQDLANPR